MLHADADDDDDVDVRCAVCVKTAYYIMMNMYEKSPRLLMNNNLALISLYCIIVVRQLE